MGKLLTLFGDPDQTFLAAISKMDSLNPMFVILHAALLVFSPYANFSIFTSIVAFITITLPHNKMQHWLALAQFLVLWYVLEGNNLLIRNDSIAWGTGLDSDHHANYQSVQDNCQSYYQGYFSKANNHFERTYHDEGAPDGQDYWGLCSPGWVVATIYIAQAQMVCLAWMFLMTLWNVVAPQPEPMLWCCCKKGDAAVNPDE